MGYNGPPPNGQKPNRLLEALKTTGVLALLLLFVVAFALGMGETFGRMQDEVRQAQQSIYDMGKRAGQEGVSSEANPYQGAFMGTREARLWLDGWIEGKRGSDE